jgi:hypothetical protein
MGRMRPASDTAGIAVPIKSRCRAQQAWSALVGLLLVGCNSSDGRAVVRTEVDDRVIEVEFWCRVWLSGKSKPKALAVATEFRP